MSKRMQEENTTTTAQHWAVEAGAALTARRAARKAERQAQAEADGIRQQLPVEVLHQRFAATVNAILEAVEAFAVAGGVTIEASPASTSQVELRAFGDEVLRLVLDGDDLRVVLRSRGRGEERHIDVADETFSPDIVARTIRRAWLLLGSCPHASRRASRGCRGLARSS